MTTSQRGRTDNYALPIPTWRHDSVQFSIILHFPHVAAAPISREEIAAAIRRLGFVPEGSRFAISIVMGSVQDVVNGMVARELREREERQLVTLQRLPPRRDVEVVGPDPLPEAANG